MHDLVVLITFIFQLNTDTVHFWTFLIYVDGLTFTLLITFSIQKHNQALLITVPEIQENGQKLPSSTSCVRFMLCTFSA